LAISKLFAREGGIVVISSRSKEHVDAEVENIRKEGGRAEGIVCHAGKVNI